MQSRLDGSEGIDLSQAASGQETVEQATARQGFPADARQVAAGAPGGPLPTSSPAGASGTSGGAAGGPSPGSATIPAPADDGAGGRAAERTVARSEPAAAAAPLPSGANRRRATGRRDGGDSRAAPRDTRPMTITDAREMALRNNLELRIAQMDPRIAAILVNEERAKFDDLIFARAKYGKKYTPRLSGDLVTFKTEPGSILEGQEARIIELPEKVNQLELDAGITVPLRTGGKFTVSAPFSQKNALTQIPSDQFLSALRFSISQPLLRDAGVGTNVASIRIAEYDRRAADVKTRLQAIRVLAAVDKAYWSVYGAWAELDVRRQQYENALGNLKLVRRRVDEGISAAVEVNRAEVGVAERLESLVQAETALRLRERQLKVLLNDPDLELASTMLLVPETRPELVRFDFDRELLVRKALAGRLELLELELKLAADLVKIDYLENQTLPLFMLEYSYAPLGQSGSGFGSSWNDTFGGPYEEWYVGARFEVPLTNQARRSKLERAIQERQQRLASRQLREITVRREILDALDQLQQNWQRILASRQNVAVAGILYDAERRQFDEGLRTMTEVLEALTRLGEAQIREVKAIVDYQAAQIDLAFATGTLLGYGRVVFTGPGSGEVAEHQDLELGIEPTTPLESALGPGGEIPDAR